MAKIRKTPDTADRGLPSWAPNWNPPGNAEYFSAPFSAAGDLPMYHLPFIENVRDGILHARGFCFANVDRTLPTTDHNFSPLSVLSNLFISTVRSTNVRRSDIRKLASTLTGPSIAELCIDRNYFTKNEAVLYTSLILIYSFVTPGLRIVDLLPYTRKTYDQSQRDLGGVIRALRPFRNARPPSLRWLDLEKFSAAIPEMHDQTARFGHFVELVHRTLSAGRLVSISATNTLAITEGNASVRASDEVWILFGCPTPMILRRTTSVFLVVSPAYVSGIMNGEAMEGVVTPDDRFGGWTRVLRR